MILFFQRARAGASFSSFPSFSFSDADMMRAILFYEERSGRGRVLVRENLPLERDEFALYARIGNAQNERSRFCSESFEKKEKGARSLEISARARALSRRTRRSARGKNGRNLSRTFTCTRSCAFYSREFFFLSSCVCFVCARLVLTTFFLLSRFQNEDIFRFSFCFLGAKLRKRGKWERKRRHEVRKERGYFFLFFGGKDLSVVLPKRTQT